MLCCVVTDQQPCYQPTAVIVLQARLYELREAMAAERSRREQVIASNPTATIWRSAAPKSLRTPSGKAAAGKAAGAAGLVAAKAAPLAMNSGKNSIQPSAEPTPRNHDSKSSADDDSDHGAQAAGSMLDGDYDERANRQSFLEALNEWRQGGAPAAATDGATLACRNWSGVAAFSNHETV